MAKYEKRYWYNDPITEGQINLILDLLDKIGYWPEVNIEGLSKEEASAIIQACYDDDMYTLDNFLKF